MKAAILTLALATLAAAQTQATIVMAVLSIKPGHAREEVVKHMPAEIRATLQLYLDGKIHQWYSKADGRGVVFFVNAKSAEEAAAILNQLPLIKDGIAQFDYTPLAPLSPLRYLMETPTK